MKGSVKLPVFIDDARKLVNTTQLRAKYLGASYEAEYCQWQTLHGLGSLMETASLIITPNAYLEGKLLASYPPDPIGDFNVTRATTATRVNSQGLVELVPYNLFRYSEDFSNSAWTKSNSTISSNTTTAPNKTLTADTLSDIVSASSNDYLLNVQSPLNYTSGTPYTVSFYAKNIDRRYMYIRFVSNAFGLNKYAYFDLQNGVISTLDSGVTATIESVGNGWYRCTASYTATVTIATIYGVYIGLSSNGNNNFYTNASVKSVYIWGAQLVEGSVAKDYQKTETRLNIPRIDYSLGGCPSILLEPQRTNLALQSSSFDSASWTKDAGVIVNANTSTSPSGVQDADRINFTINNRAIYRVGTSTGAHTFSIYLKGEGANIGKQIQLIIGNVGGTINVTLTDQWQRFTADATSSTYVGITKVSSGQADAVLAWGAQLEAGSYATSYIPTTSASVTRNADVISKTGISSLIGQTEGTIFIDFVLKNPLSATNRIISITEPSWTDGSIRLDIDYNKFTADFVDGGGNIGNIGYFTTVQPNTRYKVAIAYKVNDCQMYVNGVDAGNDTTTGAMPTCSELYLNALGGGFNAPYEASNINAAALWKTRLTNTQLAQLTTI